MSEHNFDLKHYISASYKLETEAFLPSVNYKFWRKSLIFNNEIAFLAAIKLWLPMFYWFYLEM